MPSGLPVTTNVGLGMWARAQGAKGGKGNGFANYSLYRAGKNPASEAREYFDVTLASNGLDTAGAGRDDTTGWGTPKVSGLICDSAGKC